MNSSLPAFRNPRIGLTENFKHRPRPPTALTENFKRCPRLRQHLRKILSIVRGLRQHLRKILSTVVGRRRSLQKILSTIVGRQSIFFILISSFLILKFPANSPQAGNCARNRRQAAKAVIERPIRLHRLDVVPPCRIFLGDSGIQVEDGRFSHQIQSESHFVTPPGSFIGPCSHLHLPGLQVELAHHFPHVQFEIVHALLCLRIDQIDVRLCHAHSSAPASPVKNRNH